MLHFRLAPRGAQITIPGIDIIEEQKLWHRHEKKIKTKPLDTDQPTSRNCLWNDAAKIQLQQRSLLPYEARAHDAPDANADPDHAEIGRMPIP